MISKWILLKLNLLKLGKTVVEEGSMWRVSDSSSIDVWRSKWIPKVLLLKLHLLILILHLLGLVRTLRCVLSLKMMLAVRTRIWLELCLMIMIHRCLVEGIHLYPNLKKDELIWKEPHLALIVFVLVTWWWEICMVFLKWTDLPVMKSEKFCRLLKLLQRWGRFGGELWMMQFQLLPISELVIFMFMIFVELVRIRANRSVQHAIRGCQLSRAAWLLLAGNMNFVDLSNLMNCPWLEFFSDLVLDEFVGWGALYGMGYLELQKRMPF